MNKSTFLFIILLSLVLTTISCSTSKSCNKKNKTRVEMGWM